VQRKQQVGECWVCVIFFARVVVSETYFRDVGGLEGGSEPPGGVHITAPNISGTTYFRDDIFPGPHDI
jgi:hypothetical protein